MSDNNKVDGNAIPEYDDNIPFYILNDRVATYYSKSIVNKKSKYNKILGFMQEWLSHYNITIKSLSDFKNISLDIVLTDTNFNEELLGMHMEALYNELNVRKDSRDEKDIDNIDSSGMLLFVKRILKTIDYTLIFRITKDKYRNKIIYCSIKY